LVRDAQSVISADSNSGNDGAVAINSPGTDLNPGVMLPEVSLGSTAELSANACSRGVDGARSTLVRATRGGVSASPDGYLTTLDAETPSASRIVAANASDLRVAQTSVDAAPEGCR
jgi:hypothetical protein